MSDDDRGCLSQETQSIGAPCLETESTEPSKRLLGTNLTVRTKASEISVYQLSHAADFSRRTIILPPPLAQRQQQIGGNRPEASSEYKFGVPASAG